ncbi:MAG TPA: flagellar basal body rod protein FlgB [Rhodocyclaceae bacterium]
MIDRLDNEFRFQQTALNLRAFRQELLASNVANADTPNFKARDIDFKSALAGALAGKRSGDLALNRTTAGHLSGEGANRYGSEVQYRAEFQGSVDGNTVNMDVERAALSENAVHIEALLTFMRTNMKDLQSAMQN